MSGEMPMNPEDTMSARERAQEILKEIHEPQGVERVMSLDGGGLVKEREFIQKGLDYYRHLQSTGETQGVHNARIIQYEQAIPELEKNLEALDMLAQDAKSK